MSDLSITPWHCPMCVGGITPSSDGLEGPACPHCSGTGLTNKPGGPADLAPRPPGVMRAPCADCAYRPESPEREALGSTLPVDEPFFCHQGVPVSAKFSYVPTATFRGLPLGLMVCAGWWAFKTGEPLPAVPYREVPLDVDRVAKKWSPAAPLKEDS